MNGVELIQKIAGAASKQARGFVPLRLDGPRRPQKRHMSTSGKLMRRGYNVRGAFRVRHFELNRPSPGHALYRPVEGRGWVRDGFWPKKP